MANLPRKMFLVLASASCLAGPAFAAGRCSTADIERQLSTSADALAARPDLAGVSVAFGIGDTIRWERAFGMADEEQRVPMTPASKVRIGSVSKIVTTAVLAGMVADRRVDLDEPIQTYVPAVPKSEKPMTLRHLTSHTAGIRHYVGNDRLVGPWGTWDASHAIEYKTVDAALGIFLQDDLLFQPGVSYSYSSYGWTIVSAAMEKAAGRPFLDVMGEDLVRLGLHETVPDRANALVADRAAPYASDNEGVLRPAPAANRSFLWAGGGYLSTAPDLVRLALAFRPGGRLNQPLLDDFFTPVPFGEGKVSEHGIGWMVGFEGEMRAALRQPATPVRTALVELYKRLPRTVWHAGGAPGGTSFLFYDPQTQASVSLVTNSAPPDFAGWYSDVELVALSGFARLVDRAKSCRGG